MEFSRTEYQSGQLFPPPGDLPNPGTEPASPSLQVDSLPAEPQGKPKNMEWQPKPSPAGFSNPGIKMGSPALQADSLPTELSERKVLLYFPRYYRNKNVYFLCLAFMYYLCEKYYKHITVQCCVANCISWVPRLTLSDLQTNYLRIHSWNGTCSYLWGLLCCSTLQQSTFGLSSYVWGVSIVAKESCNANSAQQTCYFMVIDYTSIYNQ